MGGAVDALSAAMRLPRCWAASSSGGKTAAALSSDTRPAEMPPIIGSTSVATTSAPSLRSTNPPMARSGRCPREAGRGATTSRSARARPRGLKRWLRRSEDQLVGIPRLRSAGSGRTFPRAKTLAPDAAMGRIWSAAPSSSTSTASSRRRASTPSGPASTVRVPTVVAATFPPIRSVASMMVTCGALASGPAAPPVSSQAAASPAIPPPTMTTSEGGELLMAQPRQARRWRGPR